MKDSQFLNKQGEPKTIKAMQTTFSTTFILRTAKTRDGLTPVYCRITVAGNRSEFSIKRSVPEKSWDAGKVKGNNEDAKSLNSYLKQVEVKPIYVYGNDKKIKGKSSSDHFKVTLVCEEGGCIDLVTAG